MTSLVGMPHEMMGQKCFVTLKMHRQLYKEHLSLQKSFCALYRHVSKEKNAQNAPSWFEEKRRLESMALHLQRKLEDANERCELLEFCLLELENHAQVCEKENYVDKATNTDIDFGTWERNILNDCDTCAHSVNKEINIDEVDVLVKLNRKSEMESEKYRLKLEETQKKLFSLTEQLDSVLKCNCKLGVGMDYVIATVNELQSLIEWTAGKKELKADSGVILQKLQQLERIQKDLEKTATESEEIRTRAELERTISVQDNKQIQLLQNICKDSENLRGSDLYLHSSEQSEELLPDDIKVISSSSVEKSDTCQTNDITGDLIDLNAPEILNVKEIGTQFDIMCSSSKDTNEYSHDSLGPNISEDEGLGEESRRGDSTGPSSFIEIQDSVPDSIAPSLPIPQSLGNEIIILETDEQQKTKEWVGDMEPKSALDACLCAISNLQESLRAKENELLKLSAIQNDQKQIAALQDVIIKFHMDTNNLKSELEVTRKENASLKEQVLELEEAENDARLQAQKLGEKLLFLQEKDTHFQAELSETKKALEKCIEELTAKEMEERELRSQLKYMEALAQKYEDQIRTMEIVEIALRKKLIEQEDEFRALEKSTAANEVEKCEKGTQTYEPPAENMKVFCDRTDAGNGKEQIASSRENEDSSEFCDGVQNASKCVQFPEESFLLTVADSGVQTEINTNSHLLESQSMGDYTANDAVHNLSSEDNQELTEDPNSVASNIDCPVQKELLKRLHQLVEDDAHLQQQLHYVDQINLALWKKLHNLEFHIGECKRRNISEDCASDSCIDSECDLSSRPHSREQVREDSVGTSKCESPSTNRGIITCLDKSEQEIKERLLRLEQINTSFEKELENREQLYLEKEKKYGEWVQTEQRFIGDLKRLTDERDSLVDQVNQLQKEKEELSARVLQLQKEMDRAKEEHQKEIADIKGEQHIVIAKLQQKIDELLSKEREHLKQITNLKLERNKASDKAESDKLKASYVELQLELSRTRDVMMKMEEEFRARLDESRRKHMLDEARLISELEMLRNKNKCCDEMINSFQSRQKELMDILKQKEQDLEVARLEYRKNMEVTEEEHRAVEAELKRQLRQMEEGTAVATRALTDERMRIEKELQENIDDLRSKEEVYKARIAELENNVTHLHDELHRITGDLDSGFGSEVSSEGVSSFRREKLLSQLRELRDREAELREKLDEMEQKEAAYRETLEHADRIVASVEQGYKNKIEELEISEKNLKQRVGHLEEVESRLRGALHKERRSSDGRKPDDLVLELLEAEVRENGLKEKIETLEQLQRNSMNKVKDLEKLREKLEIQLSDKEELTVNLNKTQQELELARKSLAKLKNSESDLKSSLQQTENLLSTTESQMRNKIQTYEEEKKGLEQTINELRAQVRELTHQLERISDDEDEESMSVAIPSQNVAPTGLRILPHEDMEDFDYAEVDDCLDQTEMKCFKTSNNSIQNEKAKPDVPLLSDSNSNKSTPQPINDTAVKQKLSKEQNDNRLKVLLAEAARTENSSQAVSPQSEVEDHDYDEVLPRPTNFRVVQQVGSDTLLVGWDYVNPSVLEGFEVYLNGQLHETVYTPDRTKALISGLNLDQPLTLSICALSRYGQMSNPTVLELQTPEKNNGFYFQDDDDEGDDGIFDDAEFEKHRPYSMEW